MIDFEEWRWLKDMRNTTRIENFIDRFDEWLNEQEETFIRDGICKECGGNIVTKTYSEDHYESYCEDCHADYTD